MHCEFMGRASMDSKRCPPPNVKGCDQPPWVQAARNGMATEGEQGPGHAQECTGASIRRTRMGESQCCPSLDRVVDNAAAVKGLQGQ